MNRPTSAAVSSATVGFQECVEQRDYVGAIACLDVDEALSPVDKLLWTGYLADKRGNCSKAEEAYLELLHGDHKDDTDVPLVATLYLAIVYLHQGSYTEAEDTALSFEPSDSFEAGLKSRILLNIALHTKDETKLAEYRQQLSDSEEDKLSIAAVEFSFRRRYQDAIDAFRGLLANDTDALALYVYTAMALFQMGNYEQSLEALSVYCQSHPESPIAANLKACNMFKLCDGKAALEVLDALCDRKTQNEHDLVRHNTVVFNGGAKALQVWPKLVDRVPEAQLNLATYYIKQGEFEAAAGLLGDMEADSPQSHAVLGTLNAELFRVTGDLNALAKAKNHFQCMGELPAEMDTVPGRQCMASYLYLNSSFEDVVPYLESIESYLEEDNDDLNWNLGISLAARGRFEIGLQALLRVTNESYKKELAYSLWLVQCYVRTNQPEEAWECYLQIEDSAVSYEVLQLIGNECYKKGGRHFLYSARSFAELLKMDSYPDFVDGLMGSSAGYFRHCAVAEQKTKALSNVDRDNLMEIVELLEASQLPKGHEIARAARLWVGDQQ